MSRARALGGALALVLICALVVGPAEGHPDPPGGLRWAVRHDGGSQRASDVVRAVAATPSGSLVFVTGHLSSEVDPPSGEIPNDYAIAAFDGATGVTRWVARWTGSGQFLAYALVVSRDGTRVFAMGHFAGAFGVIAYDAATGEELWIARYEPSDAGGGAAVVAVLSPDDSRLYVGGSLRTASHDFATVAFDASTGEVVWASRHENYFNDFIAALAVAPDGARVYVTGPSQAWTEGYDYLTIGYDSMTGEELWKARHQGALHQDDYPTAVGVSPDGARVYVTGEGPGERLPFEIYPWAWTTIAYDAGTGEELWRSEFDGPVKATDYDPLLAVGPEGERVYVAGTTNPSHCGGCGAADLAVVAYDALSGNEVWKSRYTADANSEEWVRGFAVDPDGARLQVAMLAYGALGRSGDFVVASLDTGTGAPIGSARFDSEPAVVEYVPWNSYDQVLAMALDSSARALFVAGTSEVAYNLERPVQPPSDWIVLAYDLGPCGPGRPPEGPLSHPIHETIEPKTGPGSSFVRTAGCEVLVPAGL